MADEEHLKILKQGVKAWNKWRDKSPELKPDLSKADLNGSNLNKANLSGAYLIWANLTRTKLISANLKNADLRNADMNGAYLNAANLGGANLGMTQLGYADLSGADLSGTHLGEADLRWVNLVGANLSGADLSEADLSEADLKYANLSEANLRRTHLMEANLHRADLSGADLSEAYLGGASLIQTNLEKANLAGCSVYGISAWDLNLEGATQENLIISLQGEPTITVDNLEVAQFIYLLLNNEKIRDIINTITRKVVLILGRFTEDRKAVLDTIREKLRTHDYMPVIFDFEKSPSRSFIDTVKTLALMSRFVIVDISDALEARREMEAIKSFKVPVQPVLEKSQTEFSTYEDFKSFPWFLPIFRYNDIGHLLASLSEKVIVPAEAKAEELKN